MAQTFKHTLAFALLFLFSFISPSLTGCNIPSDFWCDNADIAKQCGVFEQCQKWLTSTPGDAPVVQVALYYESLCFYCKEAFAHQVKPAFEKVHDIMNLTLVPYGNAKEEKHGDKWTFTCQHGEEECLGNQLETCAINLVKNITVYFPLIACMEGSSMDPMPAIQSCAKQHPVPLDKIIACSQSLEGNQMEHEMALRTPVMDGVPWYSINGIDTEKIQDQAYADLIALVCKTYTGSPKPAACTKE